MYTRLQVSEVLDAIHADRSMLDYGARVDWLESTGEQVGGLPNSQLSSGLAKVPWFRRLNELDDRLAQKRDDISRMVWPLLVPVVVGVAVGLLVGLPAAHLIAVIALR